jgi:AcrR family transcriptional regulator
MHCVSDIGRSHAQPEARGPVAPDPSRRLPPGARRELILDAAREAILARGLSATSVRDIARAAGVSSGTVTYHFPTVDLILGGVLRRESERFRAARTAALDRRRSGLDGLLMLGDAMLADRREVHEYWRLWLDHWARATHDPELAKWQGERYAAWGELIGGLIAEGIEAGELAPADPAAAATELIALLDGLALQAVFPSSPLTLREARAAYAAAISRWPAVG